MLFHKFPQFPSKCPWTSLFPVADAGFCPVKLGMMSNRLQSGVNSLQGFREDKRNRITPGGAGSG